MTLRIRSALDGALAEVSSIGSAPPCSGPQREFWTSDTASERAIAARLCAGCPVFRACQAAAEDLDEKWHVWAGHDRTTATLGQRRRAS